MKKRKPLLYEEKNGQICGFKSRMTTICGEPATFHYLWDFHTMENSFACEGHDEVIEKRYEYVQKHEVVPDCGMPDSIWHFDENTCRVAWEPEEEPLEATEERPLVAVPG